MLVIVVTTTAGKVVTLEVAVYTGDTFAERRKGLHGIIQLWIVKPRQSNRIPH
jgi:hypothetical protein